MRCSFRTHQFSRTGFPGRMPWAGMRCPVGANGMMSFPVPDPCLNGHRVTTCRRGSVGANPATTFPILCPDGASHTSPGCKPWESARKRNPRSEGTPRSCGPRNVFLAWDRMRGSGFVLADEDVSAPGPSVEAGADVPGYSAGSSPPAGICKEFAFGDRRWRRGRGSWGGGVGRGLPIILEPRVLRPLRASFDFHQT